MHRKINKAYLPIPTTRSTTIPRPPTLLKYRSQISTQDTATAAAAATANRPAQLSRSAVSVACLPEAPRGVGLTLSNIETPSGSVLCGRSRKVYIATRLVVDSSRGLFEPVDHLYVYVYSTGKGVNRGYYNGE